MSGPQGRDILSCLGENSGMDGVSMDDASDAGKSVI